MAKFVPGVPGNGERIQLEYSSGNLAPHSSVTRLEYTVPEGKRLFIEYCYVHLYINTAASAVSLRQSKIELGVGGSNTDLVNATTNLRNEAGYLAIAQTPVGIFAEAGDVIKFMTQDGSSGGTCRYHIVLYGRLYGR